MKSLNGVAVVAAWGAIAVGGSAVAQEAVQWRVEDGGNGHWYQFHPAVSGRDWDGWNAHASSVGGHLATITSPAENAFVSGPSVFVDSEPSPNGGHARIGAYQEPDSPEPSQGWMWITGELFDFDQANWGNLEDCCGGSYCNWDGEDSAAIWSWAELSDRAMLWNDVGKCLDWWGAVIEWSADCNGDGIVDYGQILDGTFADANANGVPDCCDDGVSCDPCPGDVNNDGQVNGADISVLLGFWGLNGKPVAADINQDGSVDGADLAAMLGSWGECP